MLPGNLAMKKWLADVIAVSGKIGQLETAGWFVTSRHAVMLNLVGLNAWIDLQLRRLSFVVLLWHLILECC